MLCHVVLSCMRCVVSMCVGTVVLRCVVLWLCWFVVCCVDSLQFCVVLSCVVLCLVVVCVVCVDVVCCFELCCVFVVC